MFRRQLNWLTAKIIKPLSLPSIVFLRRLESFRKKHLSVTRARYLTLAFGTVVVSIWTIFRHITNGINFDVVGQVGLADQWSRGLLGGAQVGATNYILKLPLYFLVNSFGLGPMNTLLVLALICNIATFILLLVLFEKMASLFEVRNRSWLYLAMAWLASIAGGIFWMDYANSRNLETVGGVLFIYLVLRYIRHRETKVASILVAIGSLLFFADSLQFYVCGVGVCLYVVIRWLLSRSRASQEVAAAVIGLTLVGYAGSRLLILATDKALHLSYLAAPTTGSIGSSLTNVPDLVRNLLSATLKIFNADFLQSPYGLGTIRELLNAIVLGALVIVLLQAVIKRKHWLSAGMLSVIILTNYAVYVASGQAMLAGTSRYLVMVPLLALILLSLHADTFGGRYKTRAQYGWAAIIVISSCMVLGALIISWPQRHQKDQHIGNLISFMSLHNFKYALGSRETGVTTTYFAEGKAIVLPMACGADHQLQPDYLFYDKAMFTSLDAGSGDVPIILQGGEIKFGDAHCTRDDIMLQLGPPKRELNIPGVGQAEIYSASSVLRADRHILPRRVVSHSLKQATPPITADASTTLAHLEHCDAGTTEVIVAHQDDDLLFMNPALEDQLKSRCVRSVYLTAGDDGRPAEYWQARERGIEAAYALMLQTENNWVSDSVTIHGHSVLGRKLLGHPSVGLLFLRLPDGNTNGDGFPQTGQVSLAQVSNAEKAYISALDNTSRYSYADLLDVLRTILRTDKPDTILSHIMSGPFSDGDHSDHRATGRLAALARNAEAPNARFSMFIGYPSGRMNSNISDDEAAHKKAIFIHYAHNDFVICGSHNCINEKTYERYFNRSYHVDL